MRRSFAAGVVAGLVGVLACGSFEATGANGAPTEDAGTDGGKTKPPDGGTSGEKGADGGSTCEVVIKHEFDTSATGGWTSNGTGLEFAAGPEGIPALKVSLQSGGELVKSYLERTITYAGIRSVHSEFSFAYDEIDPNAGFGCVTNLSRSVPFGEARLELSRDKDGLDGAGGFGDDTGFHNSELAIVDAPDPGKWGQVTFDLALADDGTIVRKLDLGGQSRTLSTFTPSGSTAFDGVHVLCGVIGLQGTGSAASIYLKGLTVTAC